MSESHVTFVCYECTHTHSHTIQCILHSCRCAHLLFSFVLLLFGWIYVQFISFLRILLLVHCIQFIVWFVPPNAMKNMKNEFHQMYTRTHEHNNFYKLCCRTMHLIWMRATVWCTRFQWFKWNEKKIKLNYWIKNDIKNDNIWLQTAMVWM